MNKNKDKNKSEEKDKKDNGLKKSNYKGPTESGRKDRSNKR